MDAETLGWIFASGLCTAVGGAFLLLVRNPTGRLLDVLLGEPSLFPTNTEVELSWRVVDPIEEAWAARGKPEPYPAGTWGPAGADELLARDGRRWRRP